jgi:hypothetical protein
VTGGIPETVGNDETGSLEIKLQGKLSFTWMDGSAFYEKTSIHGDDDNGRKIASDLLLVRPLFHLSCLACVCITIDGWLRSWFAMPSSVDGFGGGLET